MSITLEKPLVLDLINFKLRYINNEKKIILDRWKEDNTDDFLQKARDGRLEEAENDAIELRQLLLEEDRLRKVLKSI